MKTGWKSLIVVGAVLTLVGSQVMAQPWGGGPGRGRGFGPGQGRGMGWMADRPGPMRQGIGPGGPQGGPGAWCPLGAGPRGQGFGRGQGMGLGWRADRPGPVGQGMGPGGCPFCCPLGPAPGSLPGLAWWLDLTEEQTKKIGTIYEKAQTDANAVTEAVVSARDALHKAVTSGGRPRNRFEPPQRPLARRSGTKPSLGPRRWPPPRPC